MRYFVLCESGESEVDAYIVAEVVRDGPEARRELSLAANIAGAHAEIVTRAELIRTIEGRRALEAWDARDDSAYDRHTEILAGTYESPDGVAFRVVGPEDREPAKQHRPLPRDPRFREIVIQSRGLRQLTRTLVEQARTRRVEHGELLDAPEGREAAKGDG
jgi:hypothetical protein